jgi:hypothetical protein
LGGGGRGRRHVSHKARYGCGDRLRSGRRPAEVGFNRRGKVAETSGIFEARL